MLASLIAQVAAMQMLTCWCRGGLRSLLGEGWCEMMVGSRHGTKRRVSQIELCKILRRREEPVVNLIWKLRVLESVILKKKKERWVEIVQTSTNWVNSSRKFWRIYNVCSWNVEEGKNWVVMALSWYEGKLELIISRLKNKRRISLQWHYR